MLAEKTLMDNNNDIQKATLVLIKQSKTGVHSRKSSAYSDFSNYSYFGGNDSKKVTP